MKKLFLAAVVLTAAFSIRGQTPPPSFPSGGEASSSPPLPSTPKIDAEKEQLIRQVLTRSREVEMAQERLLQSITGLKQMMPRVPEKYWVQYRQMITTDDLRSRLVYIYDRHFTADELRNLLQFYDSPLGRKLSDEALPVLRESMDLTAQLSKRAAQAVISDFRAEQLLQRPRAAGSLGGPTLSQDNPIVSPTPTASPNPP